MIALAIALAAAPPTTPAPPPPPATAPVDPARLAIAQKVVGALVPDGVYLNMMRDKMPAMVDAMMAQMGGMTAADMGLPSKGDANETMDQAAAKADPAFRERMSISTRVMFEEMGKVFGAMEPRLRAGLSRAFARKFTAQQLADMDAFFSTPSGKAFASEYLATFVDPEVMAEMARATPEIMKSMPAIMKKVEAATAHLPPAPKPKAETDE